MGLPRHLSSVFSLFPIISSLLIFTGIFTLAFAEESFFYVLLTAVLLPLSWFVGGRKPQWFLGKQTGNVLSILFLGYALIELFTFSGSFLLSLAHFLILVQLLKLFQQKTAVDYLQMYLISLTQILVAAVISTEMLFGGVFLLYICFGTCALLLLHLHQEREGQKGKKNRTPDLDIAGSWLQKNFWLHTATINLLMLILTVLFFLLLPRLGVGFFPRGISRGIALSGFSETVDLNDIGAILENPAVVMWVELLDPLPELYPTPLRWRGLAFDHYTQGVWKAGTLQKQWFAADQAGYIDLSLASSPSSQRVLKQRFTLHHLDTRVLFGVYRLNSIEEGLSWVHKDEADAVFAPYPHMGGIKYQVTSQLPLVPGISPSPAALHNRRRREHVARYLQLPAIDPRISQLATRVTTGALTPYEQAKRLETYLQRNYQYSLTLTPPPVGEDPVAHFLFQSQTGHCEYFASALALMLRTLGIPSRYVNGFLEGEWNEYGKYFLVRQRDAHSWVEAYFPEYGWIPFDATPARPEPVASQWSTTIEILPKYFDSLRMKWYSYVIGYNYRRQQQLAAGIGSNLSRFGTAIGEQISSWKSFGLRLLPPQFSGGKSLGFGILLLFTFCTAIGVLWKAITTRQEKKNQPKQKLDITFYQDLLQFLARQGYTKLPQQTPQEFMDTLIHEHPSLTAILQSFTSAYHRVRFGGKPLDKEMTRHFAYLLRVLKKEEFKTSEAPEFPAMLESSDGPGSVGYKKHPDR